MTSDQVGDTDDVRILASYFYLNQYWPPNFLARILGNGMSHSASDFGKQIQNIQDTFGFHSVDVGLIGAYNTFGLVYVINIIHLNIKGLLSKYYSIPTKWIRFVFVNSLALLFISEYYWIYSAIPFFCITFYLVDLSYRDRLSRTKNIL